MNRANIIKISDDEREDVKSFANTLLTIYNEDRIKEKNVRKRRTVVHK